MTKLSIAFIVGSSRQGRFADKPAQWLIKIAQGRQDLSAELLDLRDYPLPLFDEPSPPVANPPRDPIALAWAKALERFDGFVFITPEYNQSIPAVLKNALDYAFKEWNLKPAAFAGYGAVGAARAIQHLRLTVAALRMAPISKAVHINMVEFQALRENKPFADFPHLEQSANAMLDELSWWASALKAARSTPAAS